MIRHRKYCLWLFRAVDGRQEREALVDDLFEEYEIRRKASSPAIASIWYVMQLFKVAATLSHKMTMWRMTMIRNYIKIAWRAMKKQWAYSLLNLGGLSIGMAAFILISLYVQHERSFDKFHDDADRIYRIVRTQRTLTPLPLADLAKETSLDVEAIARLRLSRNYLVSHGSEHYLEPQLYWADPAVFDVFTLPMVAGRGQEALSEPSAMLLSERMAKKYFGDENPLGKTVSVSQSMNFLVAGVFKDMPDNAHFTMDIILPMTRYLQRNPNQMTWRNNTIYTYLKMNAGVDKLQFEDKLHVEVKAIYLKMMKEAGITPEGEIKQLYFLQPISRIHLHSHRLQEIEPNNYYNLVIIVFAVACLIIVTACINYVNLACARSFQRARDVGIRKTVGAQRGQLIRQYLSESILLSLIATGFALALVWILLPSFNHLVDRSLTLNWSQHPLLFLQIAGLGLLLGVLGGVYPAFLIAGFKPIAVLSGSGTSRGGKQRLRSILVTFQFVIAVMLLIGTGVIQNQLRFIRQRDMGYETEQIVVLPVRGRALRNQMETIKTELERHAKVNRVSTSQYLPNSISNHTRPDWFDLDLEGDNPIFFSSVDTRFTELYNIEIVEGRGFSPEFSSDSDGAFLVNETAVRMIGWEDPVGMELTHYNGRKGKVVGVMRDMHIHSLHRPIAPLYLFCNPSSVNYLSIQIKPDQIPETLNFIKETLQTISPEYPFEYAFFDETFHASYTREQKLLTTLSAFSVLTIVIAFLGLLGLTSLVTAQRNKEIAIRKSLGASVPRIFSLLTGTFFRWIALAQLIAFPAAYFLMQRWLQNFAYRSTLSPWIFILSALSVSVVSFLAMTTQAWRSASVNPALILQHE